MGGCRPRRPGRLVCAYIMETGPGVVAHLPVSNRGEPNPNVVRGALVSYRATDVLRLWYIYCISNLNRLFDANVKSNYA
jgi:hypothetical protein